MIGAAYIRVSTDNQLDYSPASQLDEILNYAKRNEIHIPENYIFIEQEGVSGKKADNRLAFQQMIAIAKQKNKPFDVILVWKFSRFARNQDESTFYKGILRKKYGIDIVSVSEPIVSGMYGRLIEMIIEWQDEFYSYNLGMEVKRGMKKKAERGFYNGPMPLGYTKSPGELPAIVASEAHIVQYIFELCQSGYSQNSIARILNLSGFHTKAKHAFTSESISYILNNPFYIGKIRWNRRLSSQSSSLKNESEWIVTTGHHEAIIPLSLWDEVQNKLHSTSTKLPYKKVAKQTHWLSGMVKCSICGKSLYLKRGKNNYFQCLGYQKGLHKESQNISEAKLEHAILSSLQEVISCNEAIFCQNSPTPSRFYTDTPFYEKELQKIAEKENRIREAYINGIDTLSEYNFNKNELKKQHDFYVNYLKTAVFCDSTIQLKSVFELLTPSSFDAQAKAAALNSIIKKIIFNKENNTIEIFYYLNGDSK